MKIRTGAITAATAVTLALSVATPATAAPAKAEVREGSFASATFVKTETITCADGAAGARTITSSYDGDAFVTSGGKSDNAWSVEFDESQIAIGVHDTCGGDDIAMSGSIVYRGGLPVFSKSAKSVDVRASGIDVFGSPVPTEFYPQGRAVLHFDANFRPTRSKENRREITADGKTFTRSRTTVRSANVTGSISVQETGVDYIDGRNLIDGATLIEASFGASTYTEKTRALR